jgi:hypothetical protein
MQCPLRKINVSKYFLKRKKEVPFSYAVLDPVVDAVDFDDLLGAEAASHGGKMLDSLQQCPEGL